jgi:2-polyprenyl-3-methyl-5-hydroxy-6-metoxy-1,4-benzoquinol methylase
MPPETKLVDRAAIDERLIHELVQIGLRTRETDACYFDTPIGAAIWVRDARRIADQLAPGSTILDWGCGAGQMSWLLRRHGFKVIASDFAQRPTVPELMDGVEYQAVRHRSQIDLPDESVDAVLSSGTLEHVWTIHASLAEVRRVLKPGGCLFIFRFPNEWSISEWVARRSGRWSHAVRMNRSELRLLLRSHGFRVERLGYDSFLPLFLGRSFRSLRSLWNSLRGPVLAFDALLTHLPFVRALSTSIRCVACANDEYVDGNFDLAAVGSFDEVSGAGVRAQ